MKRQFTCIICPNGCEISAETDDKGAVLCIEGHACRKGEDYVLQELTHPVRTIASSVLVKGGELPITSVRLDKAVPKEMIFDVMKEIRGLSLDAPTEIGQIVIEHILGTEANVIVTKPVKRTDR